MRRQVVCCIVGVFLLAVPYTRAQQPLSGSFDSFVELLGDMLGDEAEEEWGSEVMEDLYELYCHPLNLNDLKEEALTELPFLTLVQVASVLDYAERHRPILSTGELMTLNSLDYKARRLLQMFCYAGPLPPEQTTLHNLLAKSRHDLSLRSDIPLYTRMGFADYPASVLAKSPNKVYQGSQPYLSLRYSLQSMNHLEAGFQLEKDAGENGVDYWAAYALLRRMGMIHVLAVGDYRLSFGQGLVVNTSGAFGKMMMLNGVSQMDRGIRRHSSMQESHYMSGAATSLKLSESLMLSAFFSHRNIDGTLTDDAAAVRSLKTDGLHRTQLERSKKGNLKKTDWGGNVSWQGRQLRLSATFAHTRFSMPLQPKHDTPASFYRLYNAAGSSFSAFSLAHRYVGRSFMLSGETATTAHGGLAAIEAFQTEIGGHQLTLIGRCYTKNYVSINGKTFGENTSPQNETGVYAGWHYGFSRHFTADVYADYMHFPWRKYQVSQPSNAFETTAQLNFMPSERHLWNLRYKLKTKQHDWKVKDVVQPDLIYHTSHQARLTHVWNPSASWRLKSMLNGNLTFRPDEGTKVGWGLTEQVTWRARRFLQLTAQLSYFRTDDYSTRIYLYEPSLLYTFGMSSVFDEGIRACLLVTIRLPHRIEFLTKIGHTHLFKRSTIGTGLDLIPQSHREDLQMQLRWRF